MSKPSSSTLPSGWRVVRFEQMAENVTERVDNPAEADVEYYVGLEHLDPESLKIRRWGKPDDVEATKLRFRVGDIIFGRRRAYQRKVAVADFDGICSAHALVLRAREDTVAKEFLPFFMQSDTFFDRALSISVGSLSPTINWKTLAQQEFALPPLDEQRRIAEMLWAADEAVLRALDTRDAAVQLRAVLFETLLASSETASVPLRELMTSSPESGYSVISAPRETGHYVLSLSALTPTGYRPGQLKPVALVPEIEAVRLRKGDFLISRSNTIELVGVVGIFNEDRQDISFPDTMMRLCLDERRVNKRFLEHTLLSESGRAQIRRIAAGTSASMKKINRVTLASLSIALPAHETQDEIVAHLEVCSRAIRESDERVESNRRLKATLLQTLVTSSMEPAHDVI